MSGSTLPPVRHLPRWTRVGRLGEPRSPRRLPVVPPAAEGRPHGDVESRIASLQRDIEFLQQQHRDTLEKLQAEVESLRRDKKELQYKLIMEPPSRTGTTRGLGGVRPPAQGGDARVGVHLEGPLQDQVLSPSLESAPQDRDPELKGGLIASLQPLRIHSSPSHPPRPPTLQECEVIIRQLYDANSLQSQEIVRVKTLLRKKISPENYILTKTFLVDGSGKPSEEKKFPKLGLKMLPENSVSLPRSGPSQSRVVLPALKQSLSSTIADGQRRSRAVQRERFKRVVH